MSELFEMEIQSSLKSYRLRIGRHCVQSYLDATSMVQIIDQKVASLFPLLMREGRIEIEACESAKTLTTVADIIEKLRDGGATRQSRLLAVGGGIIQDVATFAASSYMRGIPWTYCPTTLLGMVDSCIGGKSSINVGPYKNIAGNFYPPEEILIDTVFYDSLAPAQKIEGLCEAVKICFAGGDDSFSEYLKFMESGGDILTTPALLAEVIYLVLSTKKKFIEEDEFDQGIRLLLNFGHTFGHALEGGSHYGLSHGIAVGLGMLAGLLFSEQEFGVDPTIPRVRQLRSQIRRLLCRVEALNGQLSTLDVDATVACFRSDKKHTKDQFSMILLNKKGYLERCFVPRTPEYERKIEMVFKSLGSELYEI